MPRVTKICRVCGKEYKACSTPNTIDAFRWQDVACSRECGEAYFRAVMAAREETLEPVEAVVEEAPAVAVEEVVEPDEEEIETEEEVKDESEEDLL